MSRGQSSWQEQKSPASVPPSSSSIPLPPNKKKSSSSCSDPSSSSAPPRRTHSIFHRVRIFSSVLRFIRKSIPPKDHPQPQPQPQPQHDHQYVVVLYFTSLRVVRRTFEDCYAVRSILRGLRVPIDERDLSMEDKYLNEVQQILGSESAGKVTLPVVLIDGRCIVGVDEIRELHESGELKKIIPPSAAGLAASSECDVCGGMRFVLCQKCSGSHKIYSEKQHGFRSCTGCNVNGLIRCRECDPAGRRRKVAA